MSNYQAALRTIPPMLHERTGKMAVSKHGEPNSQMRNCWKYAQTMFSATCASLPTVLKSQMTMLDQLAADLQAWILSRRQYHSSCPTKMPSGMSNPNQETQPCPSRSTTLSSRSRKLKFGNEVRHLMRSVT